MNFLHQLKSDDQTSLQQWTNHGRCSFSLRREFTETVSSLNSKNLILFQLINAHYLIKNTVGVFYNHYWSFELCSQIYLVNELHKIPKNTFYHEYSRIARFEPKTTFKIQSNISQNLVSDSKRVKMMIFNFHVILF